MNQSALTIVRSLLGMLTVAAGAAIAQGQAGAPNPPPRIPAPEGITKLGASDTAVEQAQREQHPMNPEQIRRYKQLLDEIKDSSARAPRDRPIPESNRIPIELSTMRPPQVLRVSPDMVSTVIFTDVTGQPWPIAAVVPGSKGWVEIKTDPERAPHIFTVTPQETYAMTNLSVWLQDSTTPVIIQVVSDKRQVDSLLELVAQARGPLAKKNSVEFAVSPQVISSEQNDLMSGLTPTGAVPLKVMGGDAQAWILNGKMYLRSRMMLRAPSARFVFSNSDGTKVYELPVTPVVNMVDDGRNVAIKVAGLPTPQITPSR